METVATNIPLGRIELPADICAPDRGAAALTRGAAEKGLVLFVHGSGSSRHSPRNRHVAETLNRGGIGTVLIDLLTEKEESVDEQTAELRFDIPLLSRRVVAITEWIERQPGLKNLPLGYFGASTGAAAALVAAAEHPESLRAVVSRGGRPDLAGPSLARVHAPTLFIVGGEDTTVLALNRNAMLQLPRQTEHKLEIIPDATHLFEEPGALDQAAALARDWFRRHFAGA